MCSLVPDALSVAIRHLLFVVLFSLVSGEDLLDSSPEPFSFLILILILINININIIIIIITISRRICGWRGHSSSPVILYIIVVAVVGVVGVGVVGVVSVCE